MFILHENDGPWDGWEARDIDYIIFLSLKIDRLSLVRDFCFCKEGLSW